MNIKKHEIRVLSTFADWIGEINSPDRKIIFQRLYRLSNGNYGDFKNIGNNIFELRIHFNQGYRIYYTIEKSIIIIIYGGTKASQKRDINKAKKYWESLREE